MRKSEILSRSRQIIEIEGWSSFWQKAFFYLRELIFAYGYFYIYEMDLTPDKTEIQYTPRIDCSFILIPTTDELDRILEQGYDPRINSFRPKLEKGAVAFGIFVGKNFASVTWAAPNARAKKEVDNVPFAVDFSGGEVCLGGSLTDSEYRGKGLAQYTHTFIYPYLIKNGFSRIKYSINVKNLPSQQAVSRFNPVKIGKIRLLRIFNWKVWRQMPVKAV